MPPVVGCHCRLGNKAAVDRLDQNSGLKQYATANGSKMAATDGVAEEGKLQPVDSIAGEPWRNRTSNLLIKSRRY